MPEVEARVGADSVDKVLADFDTLKSHFDELREATWRLLETILREEGIAIHSVQARVKSKEKLKFKYCKNDKHYKSLGDISDVVGLRVITFYADKLDLIAAIIADQFEQRSKLEDKRLGDPNSFGYSAIHMDCAYSETRLGIPEYRRFAKARFEIQITTILGHAWAEMHHPWYDETDPPSAEIRRFNRLAAVLELAEQEFLQIRREKENRERITSVRVAAKVPEIPITMDSLNAFLDEHSAEVAALDRQVAVAHFGEGQMQPSQKTGPLAKVIAGAGISTIQELEDKLRTGGAAVVEFAKQSAPIFNAFVPDGMKTYGRGISILHLAYLLAGAGGEDRLRATYDAADLIFLPGFDLKRYVETAREVAREFNFK
jgi:putative GTP pyrophosphokinase